MHNGYIDLQSLFIKMAKMPPILAEVWLKRELYQIHCIYLIFPRESLFIAKLAVAKIIIGKSFIVSQIKSCTRNLSELTESCCCIQKFAIQLFL